MKSTPAFVSAMACSVLILVTVGIALFLTGKREDLWVTMLGTFWGFFLTQTGLLLYEISKEKKELISLIVGARNELTMNRNTVSWIDYLLSNRLCEQHAHGLGFSGVDMLSTKSIETLFASPLIHKHASTDFNSKRILIIYQTMNVFQREIPTDNVDGRETGRYKQIRLKAVTRSFDELIRHVDDEGERLCGTREWARIKNDALKYSDAEEVRGSNADQHRKGLHPYAEIHGSRVIGCDGGNAVLGHPLIYITANELGTAVCPYCSRKFLMPAN